MAALTKGAQQKTAFVFGAILIVVFLAIAFFCPQPTPFQYTVFRIILALAAAGVAAMIPGFLDVEWGAGIRASGAIAVFLIVYFFSPAAILTDKPPENGPTPNSTRIESEPGPSLDNPPSFGPEDKVESERMGLRAADDADQVAIAIRGMAQEPLDSRPYPHVYPGDPASIDRALQVTITVIDKKALLLRGPRGGIDIVKKMISELDTSPYVGDPPLEVNEDELLFQRFEAIDANKRIEIIREIGDFELDSKMRKLFESDQARFEKDLLNALPYDHLVELIWRIVSQRPIMKSKVDETLLRENPMAAAKELEGYVGLMEGFMLHKLESKKEQQDSPHPGSSQ